MPIHIAVTRRVRPGCEMEFQHALHEFFHTSFECDGVLGASMLVPAQGSNSRDFGILRTFASEQDRDKFFASPMFQAWEVRARTMTEGEPEYRELHGLEAWFRSPHTIPPRWKMAVVTLMGVYPASLCFALLLNEPLHALPLWAKILILNTCTVTLLTWAVMPLLTRLFSRWLNPK